MKMSLPTQGGTQFSEIKHDFEACSHMTLLMNQFLTFSLVQAGWNLTNEKNVLLHSLYSSRCAFNTYLADKVNDLCTLMMLNSFLKSSSCGLFTCGRRQGKFDNVI